MRSKVRLISELVSSYYQLYQSSMNATPTFTLADFLSCFQIIDCSISCLLPELTNQVSAGTTTMEATLDIDLRSDLTDTMLMNLGAFIYQVSTISLSLSLSLLSFSPSLPPSFTSPSLSLPPLFYYSFIHCRFHY